MNTSAGLRTGLWYNVVIDDFVPSANTFYVLPERNVSIHFS